MKKIAGSGSGSISQRHGSADPDPPQNVMDPQNWLSAEFIDLGCTVPLWPGGFHDLSSPPEAGLSDLHSSLHPNKKNI
jgi:hypothetical protein